ncbi:MAG TPA: hypothetical protein VK988_22700 [Acidimicrobiales bacterium]|nr:hypothetical protein [Acidimicrobiales bacterium]
MLTPALAEEAVEAGWAEQHPVARRGLIPPNAVMLCAPGTMLSVYNRMCRLRYSSTCRSVYRPDV